MNARVYICLKNFLTIIFLFLLSFLLQNKPFQKAFYMLWYFLQPILAGVTGADIDFREWHAARTGLYFVCVLGGIIVSYRK